MKQATSCCCCCCCCYITMSVGCVLSARWIGADTICSFCVVDFSHRSGCNSNRCRRCLRHHTVLLLPWRHLSTYATNISLFCHVHLFPIICVIMFAYGIFAIQCFDGVSQWPSDQGAGLAIIRSRVQILATVLPILCRLFTYMCLCYQAV